MSEQSFHKTNITVAEKSALRFQWKLKGEILIGKQPKIQGGGEFYHLEALLVASNLRAIQDNTVVGGIN